LENKNLYTFKLTIIFSSIRLISIGCRIIFNKLVALLLGTQGIGLIAIYYSSTDLIRNFLSFGIPQSAVREVASVNEFDDFAEYSKKISVTKKIVIYTGLFAALFTLFSSPFISYLSFGNYDYTWAFSTLSILVFANVIFDGQVAILRGIQKMKSLALSSLVGSIIGLAMGFPLIYFLRENGIIPALVLSSIASVAFSWLLVSRLNFLQINFTIPELFFQGREMLRLGISLTIITLLTALSNYLVRIIISVKGNLSDVGSYEAGVVIVTTYFGVILGALSTEFYPKMYAASDSISKLQKIINDQSNMAMFMLSPFLVALIFFLKFFIELFYTSAFLDSTGYIICALFSLVINIYSDNLGFVLIVKDNRKSVIGLAVFYRLLSIGFSYFGYVYYGLTGLGLAILISSFVNFTLTILIVFKKLKIVYGYITIRNAVFHIIFLLGSLYISNLTHTVYSTLILCVFLLLIVYFYILLSKELLAFNFYTFIRKFFK